MERVSRFIIEQRCGLKDRELFRKAMLTVAEYIEKCDDVTLLSDGERRYSNILFEICTTLLRTVRRSFGKRDFPSELGQAAEVPIEAQPMEG